MVRRLMRQQRVNETLHPVRRIEIAYHRFELYASPTSELPPVVL